MGHRINLLIVALVVAHAESFSSGSKGTDGALLLTVPGTVVFDPRTFAPLLNPSCDNVYHFTSIYIAAGVTVKLSSNLLSGPVFWLAQGPVVIDGTIDLNGADAARVPSVAGAGGYPGGALRSPSYGPEGSGRNVFLVPLVGGQGGAGGPTDGGGAGGGALLIASSISVRVNGTITSNGGNSTDGIGGDGGAIRVVAPVIAGFGTISARGGWPNGSDGRIRFESFEDDFAGSLQESPFAEGRPLGLFLPPNASGRVRVVSIGGVPVTATDLTLNQSSPTTVVIEARFIPPGTAINIQLFSGQTSSQTVTTTPLEGTFELSRATASVVFPSGSSRVQVKASWKQPERSEGQR